MKMDPVRMLTLQQVLDEFDRELGKPSVKDQEWAAETLDRL